MQILFWGNGERGQACLQKILASGFEVVGVIDQRRDMVEGKFETLEIQAKKANIDYQVLEDLRSKESVELVSRYRADLFVLAGYARLLPPQMVKIPPMGIINTHAGRIPEFRGTAAIPWQIIRGEQRLGLTVLYADEGVDTGDVLLAEDFELKSEEGATEAVEMAVQRFPEMLVTVLAGLKSNNLKGAPQDLSLGKQYTRRNPEDGLIDCRFMSADLIFNTIRALRHPYPGAFGWLGESKIILHRASMIERDILGVPGRVPFRTSEGVVLIAHDRGLLLTEVLLDGSAAPAGQVFHAGDTLSPYPSIAVPV